MQYLLMCYFDEKLWEKLPDAQKGKIMEEYGEFAQGIVQSGHFRASAKLQPASTTTTVREKNGKRVTTDGPFAETKEQLGGFYLVEAKDLDEAIEWGARCPGAKYGTIEVRPVMEFDQP